jgi:hypothetical protein
MTKRILRKSDPEKRAAVLLVYLRILIGALRGAYTPSKEEKKALPYQIHAQKIRGVLKMIPKYYEFQSSAKVLSGRHALENLPSELKNLGAVKPMILSDEILEKIGTLQIVV